jgi:hypothetical protein
MNFDSIITLEKQLLDSSVRKSENELNRLLADDFVEFGTSGKIYDKKMIIDRLPKVETSTIFEAFDFKGVVFSPEVIQLTFKTKTKNADGSINTSLRCSIWKRKENKWQLLFHQGTRTDLAT